MNISPEYLIERKKMKSLLIRWKFAALAAVIFCIFLFVENSSEENITLGDAVSGGGDYIASIEINGIIIEDLDRIRKLSDLADDNKIKAVIVHINSPGGSIVGSELLYNAFRKISEQKPIISVMGSVATSGGYMIALGTDYIFCQNGTMTGSIGVLMQMAEITELAENLGIKFENFKSSELKAAPNPTEKITPAVRDAVMNSIYDAHDYFIELVAKHRKMNLKFARDIADGRVYTGRQAVDNNIVDEIGFEDDALKWLQAERDVDSKLKIKKYKLKNKLGFIDTVLEDFENKVENVIPLRSYGLKSIMN